MWKTLLEVHEATLTVQANLVFFQVILLLYKLQWNEY